MNQRGLTLVAVLVAAVLSVMVLYAIMTVLNTGLKGSKSVQMRTDFEQLREALITSVDCAATFASVSALDPMDPDRCGSTSAPATTSTENGQLLSSKLAYLKLKRKIMDGTVKDFTTGNLDTSGTKSSNPWYGSEAWGDWRIRTTCSANEGTLVVRAAKVGPGGGFAIDSLTKTPFDFNRPRGLIFGSPTGETIAVFNCYDKPRMKIAGFAAIDNTKCSDGTNNPSSCPANKWGKLLAQQNVATAYDLNQTNCSQSTLEAFGHIRIYWDKKMSKDNYPVIGSAKMCPHNLNPKVTNWLNAINNPMTPGGPQDAFLQVTKTTMEYIEVKITTASDQSSPCHSCASPYVSVIAFDNE